MRFAGLALFLGLMIAVAPARAEPGFGPTPETVKGATTVSAQEVAEMMGEGRVLLLFDVRDAKAFAKGHLRGAKRLSGRWSRVVKEYRMDLKPLGKDKAATIVIYGKSDQDRTAQVAVEQAVREGFATVLWMRGGFEQWHSAAQLVTG
jgi:rhodanese-related sulfurtransferase